MDAIQTIASIRWMLLRRLLAVWLLVSMAATAITYYLEISRFEDGLVALATEEIRNLSGLLTVEANDAQRLLADEARHFVNTHYLWINVRDNQGKFVREFANPKFETLIDQLRRLTQPIALDGRPRFKMLRVGEQPVIRILVAVPSP